MISHEIKTYEKLVPGQKPKTTSELLKIIILLVIRLRLGTWKCCTSKTTKKELFKGKDQ